MDVFSYGVLLLEMWCHEIPEVKQCKAMLEGLEQGNVKEMIGRCLQHDPSKRPVHTSMLMYIACLCPNLVSVYFYAIPILHFKFHKFFIYLYKMEMT